MKLLKNLLCPILLIVMIFLGAETIKDSRLNQQYKLDASELHHFAYGLLSVNTWKKRITKIIAHEIESFSLSQENQEVLKDQIESQLVLLIDQIMERLRKSNEKKLPGVIKQKIFEAFVDIKEIKKGAPIYAEAIIKEITSPQTEAQLKNMLKSRVNKYLQQSYDVDPDPTKANIVKKYGEKSEEETAKKLEKLIAEKQQEITQYALIIIALALLIFLFEGLSKGPLPPTQYITLSLALLVLLTLGVTTPMIDMEAKISGLKIVLMDHPIEFQNQILYYQSKSILDVFWIMITHNELQMKLVGVLMICFSIIFPMLKLLSSMAYYYGFGQARSSRIIDFFVLKSGKWSMADVLVVAIFMAYIGFSGIVNSQLGKLASYVDPGKMLTTNGTSLQPGFYLFFAYTVLAMFLAGFVKARPRKV